MVKKGNLAVFERGGISEIREATPTKKSMYMHVTSMPTCMNILSRFRSIEFFDDHGL